MSPLPSLIFAISHYQEETFRPPTSNLPESTPYLATNTLNQKPSLSTVVFATSRVYILYIKHGSYERKKEKKNKKKKGKDDVTTMRAHAHELINWTTWIQYYNVIYLISKFSLNPMITRVVIVKLIKKLY